MSVAPSVATPSKKKTLRLPWKYEEKKLVVKKSEWNAFVLEIEERLCADLNKELDQTHRMLKTALDERDRYRKQFEESRSKMKEARRVLRHVGD